MSPPGTGHDTDTDVMRILASVGVIAIHLSAIDTFSGIFMNGISRFSVPVFVIISGYYMLGGGAGGKGLAVKCLRLFGMMLFWSGIYYGYGLIRGEREFAGFGELLRYLLTEPVHLWYIYAIITLYAFTPLLRVFAEHAGRREYLYSLLLTFIFGSPVVILVRLGWIPILETILNKMQVPYLLGMVFMYLLGGYMRRYGVESAAARGTLYALGAAGAVLTVGGTVCLTSLGGGGGAA